MKLQQQLARNVFFRLRLMKSLWTHREITIKMKAYLRQYSRSSLFLAMWLQDLVIEIEDIKKLFVFDYSCLR